MKANSFLRFLFQTAWIQIFISLFIIIAGAIIIRHNKWVHTNYEEWLDITISVGTLTVAILVWRNEKRQDWENSLPKRMNCEYLIPDSNENGKWLHYFSVINAPLSHENDMRSWGQSILQIINKNSRANIIGFQILPAKIEKEKRIKQYSIRIYLDGKLKHEDKPVEMLGEYQFEENGVMKKP